MITAWRSRRMVIITVLIEDFTTIIPDIIEDYTIKLSRAIEDYMIMIFKAIEDYKIMICEAIEDCTMITGVAENFKGRGSCIKHLCYLNFFI